MGFASLSRMALGRRWAATVARLRLMRPSLGGKLRNMHKSRAKALKMGAQGQPANAYHTRHANKTAVFGILDRESRQVRAKVVPNVQRETLQNEILKNIHHGSAVYIDQAVAYDRLKENYIHATVSHINAY